MEPRDLVLVAVVTFRRPVLLQACLKSLIAQTTSTERFSICVVDNDTEQTARPVVETVSNTADHRFAYFHEPTPGIPAARNAAVSIGVSIGAEWIAFIDDDEQADPAWLTTLLEAAYAFRADGVQGSVLPVFEPGGSPHIQELGFHQRPLADRGTPVNQAFSGNLLLNMRRLRALAGSAPFSVRLGDFGGSDGELTMRLTRGGALIVTEPSAIVHEFVPLERQTIEWMTRRATRTTAGWVIFQRQNNPGLRYWIRRVRAITRWTRRTAFYRIRHLLTKSETDHLNARICAARLRGHIMGLRGKMVAEYARS